MRLIPFFLFGVALLWAYPSTATPESSIAEQCRAAAAYEIDGGVSFAQLDAASAIERCEKSVREDPTDPRVRAYYARALLKAGRENEAFSQAEKSSGQGDAVGQRVLGNLYESSKDRRDRSKAYALYRLSANQSYPIAQHDVGRFFEFGRGEVKKDAREALFWYRKAADGGYPPALTKLGFFYANGTGVEEDALESMKWFKLAAQAEELEAQSVLGRAYGEGRDIDFDAVASEYWTRRAAERGDLASQIRLARMHEAGVFLPQNSSEAIRWYTLAAERDDPEAQASLGDVYFYGRPGVPRAEALALTWYRRAAAGFDKRRSDR